MVPRRLSGPLAAASILLAGSTAGAQPTDPLLLSDVLERVRAASPAVAADRLMAEATRTKRDQVTAWRDPMLAATLNAGPGRMQRAEIMLEQALPWPDALRAAGRAADAASLSMEHAADATLARLVLEATSAYVEAAGIQLMIGQIDHFREELAAFEAGAAAQYETGLGPQQAILRMQLEKNGLLRRRLELASRLETLRQDLAHLAGGEPDDWIGRPLALPVPSTVLDPVVDPRAVRRRPEWRAFEASLDRIDAERAVATSAFRPDFSVRAGWMEGSIMRGGRDAYGIGLGVSLPVWRGAKRAAVEEKDLERRRVETILEDFEIETLTDARAVRTRVGTLRETLDLVDSVLLPQAEATQQATAAAYTNGRADYLDLLEAERVLLDLRLELIGLRVRLLTELATLDRLLPPEGGEATIDR